MPGIDSYTHLLLHCDGIDGSTSFPDSSDYGRTVTPIATAQVDTDITDAFGGNSGVLLCDGNSDYLSVTDFPELDLGSNDFTFDFWVRFNSIAGNQGFITRQVSGSSYFYIAWESGSNIRFRDYGGTYDSTFSWSPSINTWYHIAIVRYGNSIKCYVDGSQIGSTQTFSGNFIDRSVPLYIGAFPLATYWLNGNIDEFRFSPGIARWTSNFTPPSEPYAGDEILNINETMTLVDEWNIQTNPETQNIEETIILDDEWLIQSNPEQEQIDETIILDEEWNISTIEYSYFASKIISYNPLIYVTNSNPAKIIKVDITDPENPIKYTYEIINNSYAKDIVFNSINDYFYVICADGKVVKINKNDLEDQTIINTLDSNILQNIDSLDASLISYTSTDDSNGEIIMLDEREVKKINTDLRWRQLIQKIISTRLDCILGKILNLDLRWKATISKLINTDLRWLKYSYSNLNQYPISYTDWEVYINGVELTILDDIDMDSIVINHDITQEEKKASQAQFILNRKHDKLNYTNNGVASEITNNNEVIIKIKGISEFTGKISNLTANSETETINVIAIGERPSDKRHFISIPMSSINEDLNLYHCLVNDINIDNPYIDPDDENPEYYKGIQVDLGTKIEQNVIRQIFISPLGITGLAEEIENGEFIPEQNWTYFWFAKFENFITGWYNGSLQYLGTSLGSLSADTWKVLGATYWRQKEKDDTETELGLYQIGSAPYNDISVKNGQKITKFKWVDKANGLYSIKDEGYNYIDYIKQIADLEYQKLLNIDGQILPKTSANIILSIDAYYYYNIGLLTRINVTNTTTSNIYNNQNGFPVAVKTIRIQCSQNGENSMVVTLTCDNLKSQLELEEIDAQYPDENSDEFIFEEISRLWMRKFDPNTWSYPV